MDECFTKDELVKKNAGDEQTDKDTAPTDGQSLESNVMKHVIGAACVLTRDAADKAARDGSDENVSTFDVYIVNERGKVNGYELKHISSVDEDPIDPSADASMSEMAGSFRFYRRSQGVSPQEFYGRRRQQELSKRAGSDGGPCAKGECEPIILEISEISDTCGGTEPGVLPSGGSGDASIQYGAETPSSFIDLDDFVGEPACMGPVSKGGDGSCRADGTGLAGEEGDEAGKDPSESETMRNVIKAVEAQIHDGSPISQRVGLNNSYEPPERLPGAPVESSEDLSRELKEALLAAFVPCMDHPPAEDLSSGSFVETSIVRQVGQDVESAGRPETRALTPEAEDPTGACPEDGGRDRSDGGDDEVIIFIEAADAAARRSPSTRNNRVGRLARFFEDLGRGQEDKDGQG